MNSAHRHTLQRRRHPVASLLFVILLVAAWLLAAGVLGGPGGAGAPVRARSSGTGLVPVASTSYVVQPGDTLWSIARNLQPSGDLRPLVDRLAGQTAGAPLRAGERLRLP